MSLSKDITKYFDRSSKKKDLSDQSKEGIVEMNRKRSGKKKVASKVLVRCQTMFLRKDSY